MVHLRHVVLVEQVIRVEDQIGVVVLFSVILEDLVEEIVKRMAPFPTFSVEKRSYTMAPASAAHAPPCRRVQLSAQTNVSISSAG